jgi:hypothetical protein
MVFVHHNSSERACSSHMRMRRGFSLSSRLAISSVDVWLEVVRTMWEGMHWWQIQVLQCPTRLQTMLSDDKREHREL